MNAVLSGPRKELSPLAPKVTTFKVPVDKIGAIIGPAGKIIKDIIAQTESEIDIQDDGTVMIYSRNGSGAKRAQDWVMILAGDLEVGSVHEGIIRRFTDFGIFVEIVPGKDGLLHISNIDKSLQKDILSKYKVGDNLKVKVLNYDRDSGRISLLAPELKK